MAKNPFAAKPGDSTSDAAQRQSYGKGAKSAPKPMMKKGAKAVRSGSKKGR